MARAIFCPISALKFSGEAQALSPVTVNPFFKVKDKLYSLHEPEADCISKGKARVSSSRRRRSRMTRPVQPFSVRSALRIRLNWREWA